MVNAGDKKVVGALACQQDTYLTTLDTVVVDCQPIEGQKFEVQFHDTILFPEGGGQPCDHGTITPDHEPDTMIRVKKVFRRKLEAVHVVETALTAGAAVKLELDFARRFDHAQQHSGQHLVSAVMDQLECPTLAWAMTDAEAYVEVAKLPDLELVEQRCNDYIRQNLPISVSETRDIPTTLPADYDASSGVVRVVSIGGIDRNPCCGTHVRSTAELNCITILGTSTVRGSNARIHFVVGDRCRRRLRRLNDICKVAGESLSCQVDGIVERVSQLQHQVKAGTKRERAVRSEICDTLMKDLSRDLERGDVLLSRPASDAELVAGVRAQLQKAANSAPHCFVGLSHDEKGAALVLHGPGARVDEIKRQLGDRLAVKGGGKSDSYQAKLGPLTKADLAWIESLVDHRYVV